MTLEIKRADLEGAAAAFWKAADGYRVFAFEGEMGAGKTTFIEALCRHKGVRSGMGSPTFSIINEYRFAEAGGGEGIVYHIDLYRLRDEAEIVGAGVEDCLYSDAICFVEWPQKAPGLFPPRTVKVFLEAVDEQTRLLKMLLPATSMAEQS